MVDVKDNVPLDELAQLAVQRIGLRVPDDAHDRFISFLRERAMQQGCTALSGYRDFLAGQQAAGEWEALARAFTTGETFFFRDHGQFNLMRLRLLPELIARHRTDKALRLWSAGCASGEEAYSLAMLVDMLLPERGSWNILILGTDINSGALAKAQRGRYGKWSFRMTPPEVQQRYFHHEGDEYVLDERIRRMVTFRVSNLVSEPFPDSAAELNDFDLILCRNVFIYFAQAAVFAVAARFAATLREGGYLLTAHTELIGHPVRELESRLFAEGVVYQRRTHVPAPAIRRVQAREPARPRPGLLDETTSHSTRLPKTAAKPLASPAATPDIRNGTELFEQAQAQADRGEFDRAEQACRQALAANPLAAAPYFLLAQLAQVKSDFDQAKGYLNKAIYLDPRLVAAYLELAALCERTGGMPRAKTLRRAALGIVRTLSPDEMIEQYETTAGELAQWLAQWEPEPVADV